MLPHSATFKIPGEFTWTAKTHGVEQPEHNLGNLTYLVLVRLLREGQEFFVMQAQLELQVLVARLGFMYSTKLLRSKNVLTRHGCSLDVLDLATRELLGKFTVNSPDNYVEVQQLGRAGRFPLSLYGQSGDRLELRQVGDRRGYCCLNPRCTQLSEIHNHLCPQCYALEYQQAERIRDQIRNEWINQPQNKRNRGKCQRQLIKAIREQTNLSWNDIGKLLGLSHATIIFHYRKALALQAANSLVE